MSYFYLKELIDPLKLFKKQYPPIQTCFQNLERINHYNSFLSTRIFYGNSFGNNPYKYLVGGVNNSLFGKKEEKGINDPLYVTNGVNNINFLFGEFINLRGYNFKKFDGYKALVLNTELRIPVTKAMIGRTIKSNFLNNLQIVGFFDLGSSWNVLRLN